MPPKKPANDDNSEPVDEPRIYVPGIYDADLIKDGDLIPQARSLFDSGVLSYKGHEFHWRPGHLEHIANLFAGDPATTERDYADDLAVARAYSREQWEALIGG